MQGHSTAGADLALIMVVLGGVLLLGLVASVLAWRLRLPRVTLLVLAGIAIGPHTSGLLPERSLAWFPLVANMTLVLVGFLLGEHLTLARMRAVGKLVVVAVLGQTLLTAVVVGVAVLAVGVPVAVALLLAAVATATAPAATVAVVEQEGREGRFSEALLDVVAVDDAWGLLLFSLALAFAGPVGGEVGGFDLGQVLAGLREIGLSLLVGIGLGVPLAWLGTRIRGDDLAMAETLGMAFLAAGIALWLEASYLLAAVAMGVVVANSARHGERPFHAVHEVIWPFTAVFFVLAGASFEPAHVGSIGLLGAAYVGARTVGKVAGGALGARLGGLAWPQARWFGVALLPQAGVALGMALVAAERVPHYRQEIYGTVIGATVLFELLGPLATRWALAGAGELGPGDSGLERRTDSA